MNRPLFRIPSATGEPFDLDRSIAQASPPPQTIEHLCGTLADALSPPGATRNPEVAACVRRYLACRNARHAILPGDWFADPAWDMLLDLFVCKLEGRVVSVSNACIASGVPWSTAMRCVQRLVTAGALIRIPDAEDGRRTIVQLEADVAERIEHWVRHWLLRSLPAA